MRFPEDKGKSIPNEVLLSRADQGLYNSIPKYHILIKNYQSRATTSSNDQMAFSDVLLKKWVRIEKEVD